MELQDEGHMVSLFNRIINTDVTNETNQKVKTAIEIARQKLAFKNKEESWVTQNQASGFVDVAYLDIKVHEIASEFTSLSQHLKGKDEEFKTNILTQIPIRTIQEVLCYIRNKDRVGNLLKKLTWISIWSGIQEQCKDPGIATTLIDYLERSDTSRYFNEDKTLREKL